MHYDIIRDKNAHNIVDHRVYWIGSQEVSYKEYNEAELFVEGMGSHNFDLTDPDDWIYSGMVEDSQLTVVNKGLSGHRYISGSFEPTN